MNGEGTADVRIEPLRGEAIRPAIPALAALRIAVFREFPYLYDGTEAYEAEYLASYAASDEAVVVLAWCDGEIVGASTALPLVSHGESLATAFTAKGFDASRIYYFGESVLRASHRGRGIGHLFFDAREDNARLLGRFTHTAFCAVDRPADHPLRPAGYVPHDAFWSKRGYTKREDMKAHMAWKELGEDAETDHTLTFFVRPL